MSDRRRRRAERASRPVEADEISDVERRRLMSKATMARDELTDAERERIAALVTANPSRWPLHEY